MQLLPVPRGSLAGLAAVALPLGVPPPGALLLAVHAVGLNFRDVLNVLGMYPGDPGPPGGDCSGVVAACRAGLGVRAGEPVFGLAPGSLGTHVLAFAQVLASKPAAASFEEAGACSTVYVTVDLALWRAGGGGAPRALLVHGATGGVGLAAVDVARGARVLCVGSAGGAQKRTLLRRLGVRAATTSRGVAFASAVAALNGGVGLVLTSLTSAGFVAASLASLCAGGRLVEIAKRDIWSGGRVAQERADAGFSLVALDFLPPHAAGAALRRLAASLARGAHGALSGSVYGLASTRAAMRLMSKAQHVGKLVLRRPALSSSVSAGCSGGLLLSGGTGFLGTLISNWSQQHAWSPVLVSGRTGRGAVSRCQGAGLLVLLRWDVSHRGEALTSLLRRSRVTTALHVGGSLADAVLGNQTVAGSRAVFAPKSSGAELLQSRMQALPVTATLAFSSISSLLGNAGQANCASPVPSIVERD